MRIYQSFIYIKNPVVDLGIDKIEKRNKVKEAPRVKGNDVRLIREDDLKGRFIDVKV